MKDSGDVRRLLSEGGYAAEEINTLLLNASVEKALCVVATNAFHSGAKRSLSRLIELLLHLNDRLPKPIRPHEPAEQPENPPKETPEDGPNRRKEDRRKTPDRRMDDCVSWYTNEILTRISLI